MELLLPFPLHARYTIQIKYHSITGSAKQENKASQQNIQPQKQKKIVGEVLALQKQLKERNEKVEILQVALGFFAKRRKG